MFKFIISLTLALFVGAAAGYGAGSRDTRATIANECRQAGYFTHKRTGFKCDVIRRIDTAQRN